MFSNMLFAAADLGSLSSESLAGLFAFIAGMIVLFSIASVIFYIYKSLAFQTIAKKLGHKYPWLAWIPLADYALILELGGFHWALIFLLLIPVLGWLAVCVLSIISLWRIFEKRKYPGWLSLLPILVVIPIVNFIAIPAFLVIIGFVAWKDR